jgi:hypothetical protein
MNLADSQGDCALIEANNATGIQNPKIRSDTPREFDIHGPYPVEYSRQSLGISFSRFSTDI